jgi:hypothetical protein
MDITFRETGNEGNNYKNTSLGYGVETPTIPEEPEIPDEPPESITTISIGEIEFSCILSFEIGDINKVQLPKWINETESINENFFSKELSKINYIVRCNNLQKWNIDEILRAHSLINLTDEIYGLDTDVFIINLDIDYSFSNNTYPWIINITMVTNI